MIHRFSVDNFQSIRDRVSLDFRVPRTTPERPCFRRSRSRPDIRLPTVIAFVGPNGSGKTALLRAVVETARFASSSYEQSGTGNIPAFLPFLAPETRNAPTRVQAEFDADWLHADSDATNSLFRYTLEIERGGSEVLPTRVTYEALHTFPRGRPRRLLERCRDKPIYIAKELNVRSRDDRLSSVPPNASVISALARMDVGSFPVIAADIANLQTNIVGPDPWRPDTDAVTHYYRDNQHVAEKVSNRLQRFDLGLDGMTVESLPNGEWILTFTHQGLDTPIVLSGESSGTRHLVHIYPQLNFVLDSGHLAVIDAFDSDLHTELVAEMLNWFRRPETNPNKAQLICSIHNLSVLDELEKEEVLIVDKGRDGATSVHGARDIAGLRRGVSLQKQYRGGHMGGLPAIG